MIKSTMTRMGMLAAVLLAFELSAAEANYWPYERLKSQADIILIGVPSVSEDSGEMLNSPLWQMDFVGVNTTIQVRTIVKGRYKGRQLTLFHLRLPDGSALVKGPVTMQFRHATTPARTPRKTTDPAGPEYLLFLKERKDGRFEPVSGPLDTIYSVREIAKPMGEL